MTQQIKRCLAVVALLGAAGAAVLVWSDVEHALSPEDNGAPLAKGALKKGSGWKPRSGTGKAKSKASGGSSSADNAAHPPASQSSGETSSGEIAPEPEAEQATAAPSSGCYCSATEEHYVSPQGEYESSPQGEENWEEAGEEEGWEEAGEEEGWEEEGEEAWEEEGEEGWEEEW